MRIQGIPEIAPLFRFRGVRLEEQAVIEAHLRLNRLGSRNPMQRGFYLAAVG